MPTSREVVAARAQVRAGSEVCGTVAGVVATEVVVRAVCAALELQPTGPVRRSAAIVFPARTALGTPVVVRAGGHAPRAGRVASTLLGPWFRTPRLLGITDVTVRDRAVTVECWEHVGGTIGTPAATGRGAALLAATVPATGIPRFDPFARAHPLQLTLNDTVARDDVVAVHGDAVDRWASWCARHPRDGWTHGDWNDTNMTACTDGSFFVLDLGDAGSGPVGFDLACLLVQDRFARTAPGTVDAAVAAYAPHSTVPITEVAAWLEPVAAYVIAARIAASDDPVRVAAGSSRLESLVAERRGGARQRWASLADVLAAGAGEPAPAVP